MLCRGGPLHRRGARAAELKRGVGCACAPLHGVSSAGLIHTSVEPPQCLPQGPVLVPAASSVLRSPSPNST